MTARDGGNTGNAGAVPSETARDGGILAPAYSALPPSMAVGGNTRNTGVISSAIARPRIAIIAAIARDRVIGRNNALPWRLPADLQRFRELTTGHPLLMGRRTFESLGRPLPNRTNIVMTSDPSYVQQGCLIAHSLDQALTLAAAHLAKDDPEIFVIGGENLYRQTLARADRLYLTQVDTQVDGDAWFPEFEREAWQVLARVARGADEKNPYDCVFLTLERRTSKS